MDKDQGAIAPVADQNQLEKSTPSNSRRPQVVSRLRVGYVTLCPAAPDRGRAFAYLRYTNPDTGVREEPSLGTNELAKAKRLALDKSEWVVSRRVDRRRQEIATGTKIARTRIPKVVQYEIAEEARLFYVAVQLGHTKSLRQANRKGSPHYLRHIEDVLNPFLDWCKPKSLRYLEDLERTSVLRSWYDHQMHQPSRTQAHKRLRTDGERDPKAGNADAKVLFTFLRWTCKESKHGPAFTSEFLNDELPIVTERGRKQRNDNPEIGRVLSVQEIRGVLEAALKFDDAKRRRGGRLLAPDVALLLLTALRRAEYVQLHVQHIGVDVPSKYDPDNERVTQISVPSLIAKMQIARTIEVSRMSQIGVELLRESVRGRAITEWLSEAAYEHINGMLVDIRRDYQGPHVSSHDLRRTCATYGLKVIGMSYPDIVEYLGDSKEVANESYLRSLSGMKPAEQVEGVMRCEPQLREILRRLKERNDREIVPRSEYRKTPTHKIRGIR